MARYAHNSTIVEPNKYCAFTAEIAPTAPKKVIHTDFPQGLDVLPTPESANDDELGQSKKFQLRILEPKGGLDEVARGHVSKVQHSYEQWKAEEVKQSNEYGFMELTPDVIKRAVEEKERMIAHRRRTAPENPNPSRLNQLKKKVSEDV